MSEGSEEATESFETFCSRACKVTSTASATKVTLLGGSVPKGARKATICITPQTEKRLTELRTWLHKERNIIISGEVNQKEPSLLLDAWARGQ